MRFRILFLPTLAAVSLGGLAALVFASLLLVPTTRSFHQEMLGNYGNALSSMAARQAIDATFNHDLVQLQVTLRDVIDNPHVVLATIHDVENKLLVQAGDVPDASELASFTSPIILHDSVAGYISVSLAVESRPLNSSLALLLAAAMLFLVLAVWSMYRNGAVERVVSPGPQDGQDRSDNDARCAENADQDHSTEPPAPTPEDLVFAVVHVKNLLVLQQQLNGPAFRDTVARLEKLIADVMALYGGHRYELIDNYYVLSFHSLENRGEALFNAVCSAYLVLELGGILNKVPLDLAALVSADRDDLVPEKLPFAGLIVEITAGNETLINRRVEFMELGTEDGKRVLSGFHQPFQSLLDNQHKQLSQLMQQS